MSPIHWSMWRRMSLRSRMVVLSALVVAVVVTVGGAGIVITVKAELIDSVDQAAAQRADEVANLAASGDLPADLPVVKDLEAAVQVVRDGRVVSATENLARAPALALPAQPPGSVRLSQVDVLPFEESGPYRVAARGVTTPEGAATVLVVISVEDIEDEMAATTAVGTIGVILLVLVLSAVLWVVIGRTLAPVEAIRVRTDAITGQQLHRRVPEPPHRDEVGRLARTVNAMLARLEDSATQQRRFVADAAHELRSPIASLRAQLETARDRQPDSGTAALVPGLLDETVRMQNLVERLLLMARTDAGTALSRSTAVDLDDAIDAVASAYSDSGPVDIDLRAVRPVQVHGDRYLLEQVTRNLLDNAVRHASRSVDVALSVVGDEAVLTIDDDGPGVPPEHRDEIFRRFTRLDDARGRDEGGVGLGLAIVRDIVRAHGGTVAIRSAPTGGARFEVRLPRNSTKAQVGHAPGLSGVAG